MTVSFLISPSTLFLSLDYILLNRPLLSSTVFPRNGSRSELEPVYKWRWLSRFVSAMRRSGKPETHWHRSNAAPAREEAAQVVLMVLTYRQPFINISSSSSMMTESVNRANAASILPRFMHFMFLEPFYLIYLLPKFQIFLRWSCLRQNFGSHRLYAYWQSCIASIISGVQIVEWAVGFLKMTLVVLFCGKLVLIHSRFDFVHLSFNVADSEKYTRSSPIYCKSSGQLWHAHVIL